jgi:MFS family permease
MSTLQVKSRPDESSPAYAGWQVTLAAFAGVMVSFAAIVPYTFSLFLSPLNLAFGWKREAISRGFAIAALTVAFCSPFLGSLLDRLPPRRIIIPCIAVFAAAIASLSLVTGHIGQFYGTYFVLGLVGNGTAQLAYSRAVLTWFERRRGLALAVVLAGNGTGSILMPVLAQHVITAHGWRTAYLVLGAVALLGIPLTALFVRNNPVVEATPELLDKPSGVGEVLKTSTFWFVAIPVLLSALSLNGAIAHLAALLVGRSVTPASAALALSALGLSGIVGRLVTGHFLDRFFAPMVSLAVLLIAGIGIIVIAYATSAPTGILGAFLIGFGAGSEADVVPYLIAKYFGRARFSTLYGLTWTAYAVGAAFGPVLMGRAFDQSGSYVPSTVLLFSAPLFVAAGLQFFLPRYRDTASEPDAPLVSSAASEFSL